MLALGFLVWCSQPKRPWSQNFRYGYSNFLDQNLSMRYNLENENGHSLKDWFYKLTETPWKVYLLCSPRGRSLWNKSVFLERFLVLMLHGVFKRYYYLLLFLRHLFYYSMCGCLHAYMCTVCVCNAHSGQKKVTEDDSELPHGCLALNPDPLQEQQGLPTADPSLYLSPIYLPSICQRLSRGHKSWQTRA